MTVIIEEFTGFDSKNRELSTHIIFIRMLVTYSFASQMCL